MKYAIIYSSKTGNTKMLADAIAETLPQADCVYAGAPDEAALTAERIYAGFWTDKGTCTEDMTEFLEKMEKKEVFLFGTAGFGGEASYFERILANVSGNLNDSNRIVGTYMCQGKMPVSVRERYEKMLAAPNHAPNLEGMIENFDRALTHPDEKDLAELKKAVAY